MITVVSSCCTSLTRAAYIDGLWCVVGVVVYRELRLSRARSTGFKGDRKSASATAPGQGSRTDRTVVGLSEVGRARSSLADASNAQRSALVIAEHCRYRVAGRVHAHGSKI